MFKKYQLRSYNFRLVILLIVTSVYGIAVINSADSSYTIKQCAGLLLSLFVMVVVSLIDYNWLLRFYWIMYALNFVLLVLVLALGSESKGAQRWINIGGFRFQPSELTKILLIMFTAKLISLYKDRLNTARFLIVLAVLLLVPIAAKSFNNHFAGINFVYHYILCRLKLPDYGHCFIVYSACHHYSGYLYQ